MTLQGGGSTRSWTPPRATCQRHVSLWALFNFDATRRPLRWCPPPPSLGGGAIVKTLGVVTETGTVDSWSARMELWGGAEVAWMWCCAAPLVFVLLATLFFFLSFHFFLTCRWDGEAARKSPEEEKPGVLEVRQQSKTVGVAKVTSIPRNCSDELPEFGYLYNDSEVWHRVLGGGIV